jgi:integrase
LEECAEKKSLPDDRDHLRKLEPYLRLHRLDAVDMSALQPFIRDRKEKDEVRNATINRALEIVRRILNLAHQDWRWIRAVPKIRMLKEPRRRVRFLRRDEATRLLESMPKHMKPIVRFALSTGCRASEILGLEWNRVDLTRKVAWLDHGATKSGDGRGIPLNSDAIAALQSTFGQHPRWCFTFGGKRIQKSSSAWDRARQRAGIEDFRFHDLRHTWASWHVQSGTSLPELMELGGWKSYEMVLRYAHLAPEKLSSVASRIEWEPSQRRDTPDNEAGVPAATFPLRSTN